MKLYAVLPLMAASLGLAASSYAAELVDMDVTLPKPVFEGTPVPVGGLPHLEKPLGHPRPPFKVPAGTKNVALKMDVTSSDDLPIIGELEYVTDGDREASDGSYVELGPDLQWVQIDLKKKHAIHAMLLWHFHSNPRVYHDVIIHVSDDAEFLDGVKTVFNNDHDNSSGKGVGTDKAYIETNEGKLVDTKGVVGRFVRLYSRGNTANEMNHYVEVEVHGIPAE